MKKYTIGVDFGTLSGRAVLVDVSDGTVVAQATKEYAHGVMDTALPDGTKLGVDWALQHPQDYLDVYDETIPQIMRESGVDPAAVIGIGVDFTACTVLPVLADGTPLCFLPEFEHTPHAYVKLWKHHAAQDMANQLNEKAAAMGEYWLSKYGGKISSEWEIPKIMEIAAEAPEVYRAAGHIMEGTDWAVWVLTGRLTRCTCTAGYKGIWNKRRGYPSKEFFKALNPMLENLVEEKFNYPFVSLGDCAGYLTAEMAEKLGLRPGIPVAAGNVDAHVAVPAVGVAEPGGLLMIMGTSTCDIFASTEEQEVEGICGVVEDGVIPGYFGYESGQSCVGDHFKWFVDNCVPAAYYEEAAQRNLNIQQLLTEKSEKLKIGESGLLALDWWNGNRSVLIDVDLTGMMLGLTLATKPEEIYRALIEATAFGQKVIIDNFEKNGVPVRKLYACGGITKKNPMLMQIYADVINKEIIVGASDQTPALGAAIFGAVAAGVENGGYESVFAAAKKMGKVEDKTYRPVPEHVAAYEKLYQEYLLLHDYFGRGANDVMKRLKKIKAEASGNA